MSLISLQSLTSAPARLSIKGRNGEADLEVACAWGSFSNQASGNGAAPAGTGGGRGPAPAAKLPIDGGPPYGRSSHGSSGLGLATVPLGGDTSDEAEEEDGAAVPFIGPGAESHSGKAPLVRFATNSVTGRLPGLISVPSTAAASVPRTGQHDHRSRPHQQQHEQHQYEPHSRAAAELRSKGGGVELEEPDDDENEDGPGPSGHGGGPRSSWSRHGVQKVRWRRRWRSMAAECPAPVVGRTVCGRARWRAARAPPD